MTSSFELQNKLKFLKCFHGVFPCDRLPVIEKLPFAIIINTDKHNEPGEHWVAIYVSEYNIGYYFDSYGLQPINKEIEDYLNSNCLRWKYNMKCIQGLNSIKCGQFSVIFILLKHVGYTMNQITYLFTDNPKINDIIIQKLYDCL